ncbi:MAG: M28 family peptidase [Bacteroidota bacterium]
MKKIKFSIASLLCLFHLVIFAQEKDYSVDYAKTIQKEDLKKHLQIIASDEYEGRETGEKGQKMAAEYISKHFKNLGLEGPVKQSTNSYYQSFNLKKSHWQEVKIATPKKELVYLEDFFLYGNFSFDNMKLETVFAGYGIDEPSYTDYKNIDVKGKAVIVILDEPKGTDGNYVLSESNQSSKASSANYKIQKAGEKGAAAVFLVYPENEKFQNSLSLYKPYLQKPSLSAQKKRSGKLGTFYINPKNAATLLGISEKKWFKLLKKQALKDQNLFDRYSTSITLTAKRSSEEITTENVLGYLEGTDLKDELLVVTAHYDHIGKSGDEINNGADDDGSGTVTVLEIAEAFSKAYKDGIAPRRSILFMTVTGEEKGLLGSAYYADNPVFPIDNTIANLNIDMVGRVDKKHEDNPNYIYIIGSDMLSSELHNLHESTAKRYASNIALDYQYNAKDDPNRFYYRSDHYNFAKHGIPVIFYFNGTHEDYHKPTDTVEKIHFEKMENIAKLIFHTAWELANREKRPIVDVSAPE